MNKPSIGYWLISGLAFIWNALGVRAYVTEAFMSDAQLVDAYGQQQAAIMMNDPAWYTAAYAMAVFGGLIGCLGLLLRKKWALWPFLLSLLCVVIQHVYFVTHEIYRFVEGGAWVMVLMIPIISVFLVWYSRRSKANGLLN